MSIPILKIAFCVAITVGFAILYLWAEARDARDWIAHMRRACEPRDERAPTAHGAGEGDAEWRAS